MFEATTFSSFDRRSPLRTVAAANPVDAPQACTVEPAPPPDPPAREPDLVAEPPEPCPAMALLGVSAVSDQLGVADARSLALRAGLLGDPPCRLTAANGGMYRLEDVPAAALSALTPAHTGLARGTHILTARGEIAVEALRPGDAVLGLRGLALVPVVTIGRVDQADGHIRIEAGALGNGLPRRTLSTAMDHPIFIDPSPVPARSLVNGSTIRTVDRQGGELFQVDVGLSEVLFAEGVPLSSDQGVGA